MKTNCVDTSLYIILGARVKLAILYAVLFNEGFGKSF